MHVPSDRPPVDPAFWIGLRNLFIGVAVLICLVLFAIGIVGG